MGLVKVTTDGSRPSEWETLGFVDGAEITSNGDTETGVTTPPGASGLVAVVVTNPGGETIVVRTCSNRYCYSSRQIPRTLVVQAFTVFTFTLLGVVRLPTKSEDLKTKSSSLKRRNHQAKTKGEHHEDLLRDFVSITFQTSNIPCPGPDSKPRLNS